MIEQNVQKVILHVQIGISNVTAALRYATVVVLPLFVHVVKYETLYRIVDTFLIVIKFFFTYYLNYTFFLGYGAFFLALIISTG